MKKNGFVFIETIVVVVVLTTSLLFIYSSYSSSISKEKERIYYDDMATIYKTNNVRKFLEGHSNIEYVKNNGFTDRYIVTLGVEYEFLFDNTDLSESLQNIIDTFHISKIILVKKDYLENCKQTHPDETINNMCKKSKEDISNNFAAYLRTINDINNDTFLAIEYSETLDTKDDNNFKGSLTTCVPEVDIKCKIFYSSLGI